MSIRTIK